MILPGDPLALAHTHTAYKQAQMCVADHVGARPG